MITIHQIARLLRISPQTIRMYERYGILKPERCDDNGYRTFNRNNITVLIKSRVYQSMGFSMKQVARLIHQASSEDCLQAMNGREREIEAEIAILRQQQNAVKRLSCDIETIQKKAGTCETGLLTEK